MTCRTRSYVDDAVLKGFNVFVLENLDEKQIFDFIADWYRAQNKLGRVLHAEVESRTSDLQKEAVVEPLLSVAVRPMLLTTMAIIHQQKAKLPHERVKLYNLAVDLLLKRWQEGKGAISDKLEAFINSSEERVRPVMERLAYESHTSRAQDKAADLPRQETVFLLAREEYLGDVGLADEFLNYVDLRAGPAHRLGRQPQKSHHVYVPAPAVSGIPGRLLYSRGAWNCGAAEKAFSGR